MDPKSLASNTAALLALTIQVNGALYRTWDSDSSPTVDRLSYELSRLRTNLQYLEEAALQNENPVVLGNLPRVFMALRRSLVSLGSKLLGDENATDIPSQNNLEMVWEAEMPGREPRILPLSKSEGESLFNEFQVNIASLRILADVPDESTKIISPELLSRSAFWSHRAEYTEIHARSQRDRVKGSGIWLLSNKKFNRWLQSDRINISNREHILYCSGSPGSGKTILA
jgi:hypothetical protein